MKQYQEILQKVLKHGVERTNRTNQKDIFIPSATMEVDLRDGFPALTTKQLFYKQSIGEIIGFIRGYDNAADFRALGCNIWNSDANENATWLKSPYRKGEDDLGKIYGSTWRKRTVHRDTNDGNTVDYSIADGYTLLAKYHNLNILSKDVDQLRDVVDTIIHNPNNRRIILHAWFPELFDEMALPPCHVMYRFIPDENNKVLHMSMFQRSCDLFLGVPFNLFGSSLLLRLVAEACGYTAGVFTHNMADVHIYENAIDAVNEQLTHNALPSPELRIHTNPPSDNSTDEAIKWLENIEPQHIALSGYNFNRLRTGRVQMAQETNA